MAEQSDGPPLPPKRPTIIRAQPASKTTNGDEKPLPARPVPPIPGAKPPVPQHSSKPVVPPHSPGHKHHLHKINDGGVPHLPENNVLPPKPDHKPTAVTSKSSVRKRPEITIVGARPMSEVSFRSENSPTPPPPPPARPQSLAGDINGGVPPLPKRDSSLEPEPKTQPSRPKVPNKPLPQAPSSRPKFPLRPSQPAKSKETKQPEEGLLIDFSDDVPESSHPPLIPTPGVTGASLLDSGSSETSPAAAPSPALRSRASVPAAGSSENQFPEGSSATPTHPQLYPVLKSPPAVPSSKPASLPVPSQSPCGVPPPKSPRPVPALRSISPAVPHQPALPDKPQIPVVKPRPTPEAEKPEENIAALDDQNEPLPEKPKRPTIIRPKKSQEVSNETEDCKHPPARPKPMTPKAAKRSTIADIPVSQIVQEVPEYAAVIRPKNKSSSASEEPRQITQNDNDDPPAVPPKLFHPATGPKPTVLPKPRQSLISPQNDSPDLDASSVSATEVKSDPPKTRPTIIRPPPKPLRLHEIEANSNVIKDDSDEKKPGRPPRPVSRVQVLPIPPKPSPNQPTQNNPFEDSDDEIKANSGERVSKDDPDEKNPGRPPRPVSRVQVLPIPPKPSTNQPTQNNPFEDSDDEIEANSGERVSKDDSDEKKPGRPPRPVSRVQVLPLPLKSLPSNYTPSKDSNPFEDDTENSDHESNSESQQRVLNRPPRPISRVQVLPSAPKPSLNKSSSPFEEDNGKDSESQKGVQVLPTPQKPKSNSEVDLNPFEDDSESESESLQRVQTPRQNSSQNEESTNPFEDDDDDTVKSPKQNNKSITPGKPPPPKIQRKGVSVIHEEGKGSKAADSPNDMKKVERGPPRPKPPSPKHRSSVDSDSVEKRPSRPVGPPSRPMSAAPTFSHTKDRENIPSRPQPPRPGSAPTKKPEKPATPPTLPPRPTPSHDLYHYILTYPHGVAQYDFEASHDDEISFQEGEVIILTGRTENEWLKGKIGQKEGVFPASFIEIIHPLHSEYPGPQDSPDSKTENWTKPDWGEDADDKQTDSSPSPSRGSRSSISSHDLTNPSWADDSPSKPDTGTGPRCRARFDFEGEGQGDLEFEEGDIMKLIKHVGTDWLQGELNDKTGIFPLSFVEIIEDVPLESQTVSDQQNIATTVFDFDGLDGELRFQAGEKVCVLSEVNSEWLYGEIDGREGKFPHTFIDVIPDNLPKYSSESSTVLQEESASSSDDKTPTVLYKCRAMYDYDSPQIEDLCFNTGDTIEVLEDQGDWLKGRLHTLCGIFPKSFIEIYESDNEEMTSEERLGKALFDFNGESDKELTFKKDEVIKLGELVTGTSDWQWGKLDGKQGIFPVNFITLL